MKKCCILAQPTAAPTIGGEETIVQNGSIRHMFQFEEQGAQLELVKKNRQQLQGPVAAT